MFFRLILFTLLIIVGVRFLRALVALRGPDRRRKSEPLPGGVGGKEEIVEAQWKELDR